MSASAQFHLRLNGRPSHRIGFPTRVVTTTNHLRGKQMGFWNRVKDVLISGPGTAVGNAREEKREEEEATKADVPKVDEPKVDVPEASAPEAPEAPAPAPAEPEYRTYTVKSGDTLSEIAAGYGVDWHEMAELNNLENPDLIYPGQVFKVPNN